MQPLRLSLLGSALAALLLLPVPLTVCAQSAPAGDEDSAAARFNAAVSSAVQAFREGRFASAVEQFDFALAIAPPEADSATLEFDAAASEYELGRFADAERRFARAAAAAPALAPIALLNAGMSALRDGRVDAADRYLASAPPGDAEAESRRGELAKLIAAAKTRSDRERFQRALKAGVDAYAAGDLREARGALEESLAARRGATPADEAYVYLTLGEIAHELGELDSARQYLNAAVAHDPNNADVYVARAEVLLQADDASAARNDARHALELGAKGSAAARALRVLSRLDRLPTAGPSFVLTLGGGYDSNASQAGAAEITGVATSTAQASPFVVAGVQLDYTIRPSDSLAVVPYYLGDFFSPTAPELQPLALQAHELGMHLHLSATRDLRLGLSGGSALVLSELTPAQLLTWEGVFAARADLTTGARATTTFDLSLRPTMGLGGRTDLSGAGFDSSLEERVRIGPTRISVAAAYRYLQRGQQEIPADAASLGSACRRGACNNLTYIVPLGYQGPSGRAGVLVDVFDRLAVGAKAKIEYRRYLEPNMLRGIPASRKTREDVRYRLRADAELALDPAQHLTLLGSYEALISRSNIAFDAASPDHRFDYGDRNFIEHVVEADLELRW